MSDYEKPVNEYDFKNGERPDTLREEEKFMYKYLEMRDKKKPVEIVEGIDENGEIISDVEMEEFAEGEIEKEMKRLQSGAGGITEYDDEDVSFSDDGGDADEKKEEEGDASDSEENFFSDDDELEDVKLDGEDDDSEAEFGSQEDMGSDYGDEYDEEVQQEEQAKSNKKKGKKEKDEEGAGFADYEDFAHLLEEDAEKALDDKEKKFLRKRTFNNFEAAQHRFMKKSKNNVSDKEIKSRRFGYEQRMDKKMGGARGGRGRSP